MIEAFKYCDQCKGKTAICHTCLVLRAQYNARQNIVIVTADDLNRHVAVGQGNCNIFFRHRRSGCHTLRADILMLGKDLPWKIEEPSLHMAYRSTFVGDDCHVPRLFIEVDYETYSRARYRGRGRLVCLSWLRPFLLRLLAYITP